MKKEYINKKELIITDAKKFPSDWWNYIVNPIVGYHVPKANKKRNPKL